MSNLDFVAKVKIEPDTSQYRSQLESELKQQTPLQAPRASSGTYTAQVKAEAQANLQLLRDMKARSLARQAEIRATENLTGAYTRLSDRQVIVGKGAEQAEGSLVAFGAKAGLIGFAVTAAFQATQKLASALRVVGDDAGTSAGKLRNFGAALLSGDVIGALGALLHATTLSSDAIKELQLQAYNLDFSNIRKQQELASERTVERRSSLRGAGGGTQTFTSSANQAIKDQLERAVLAARELRITDATSKAGRTTGLEDDLEAAKLRGQLLRDQLKTFTAGTVEYSKTNAALTGAFTRRVALEKQIKENREQFRLNQIQNIQNRFDLAALKAALAGNLAKELEAKQAEAGGLQKIVDVAKAGGEAERKALSALQVVREEREAIQRQIAEEQARPYQIAVTKAELSGDRAAEVAALRQQERLYARKAAAAKEGSALQQEYLDKELQAKQRADSIEGQIRSEREQTVEKAKSAYAQQVQNNAERLRIAADAAGNRGKAEANLIAFLAREAKDAKLDTAARLQYSRELTDERQRQKQAVVAAAKADIDYKKSLLDLAVQKAEQLTPNNKKDDDRAYRAEIAFWEKRKREARALGGAGREAAVEAESQITSWKARLKSVKGGGGGFTLQQLFQAATDQFRTFGSNIAGREGVLSGQDERAAFGLVAQRRSEEAMASRRRLPPGQARMALDQASAKDRMMAQSLGAAAASDDPLAAAALTEAQKQTALLALISTAVSGKTKEPAVEGIDKDWTKAPRAAHHAAMLQVTHITGQ